jgi:hypothetical protein
MHVFNVLLSAMFHVFCELVDEYKLNTICRLKLDDSNNDDSTDDKEDEDGDNAKKVGHCYCYLTRFYCMLAINIC